MLDQNLTNAEILRGAMTLYRLSVKQVALILEMKEQSIRNARVESGRGLADIKLQFLLDLMEEVSAFREPEGPYRSAIAVPVWILNGAGDPAQAIYVHRCPITGASRLLREDPSLIGTNRPAMVYDALGLRGETYHPFLLTPSKAWERYASLGGNIKSYADASGLDMGTEEL